MSLHEPYLNSTSFFHVIIPTFTSRTVMAEATVQGALCPSVLSNIHTRSHIHGTARRSQDGGPPHAEEIVNPRWRIYGSRLKEMTSSVP